MFEEYWQQLQNYTADDEPNAGRLFDTLWPSSRVLAAFWQRHDGELSDSENEWIADRAEDIWIARSIAYASTMQGSGTIGAGKFDDSRADFGHRLNPPSSPTRQPDVTEMDWVVYWWCMDEFEDFQAEWNRLQDWTRRLYRTRGGGR
ncbi:MAG: hypothetical protein J7562_08935 [Agrobacterium tumefaciens]|nr:hypothetical protein [Agrobacterium tumefaciens]